MVFWFGARFHIYLNPPSTMPRCEILCLAWKCRWLHLLCLRLRFVRWRAAVRISKTASGVWLLPICLLYRTKSVKFALPKCWHLTEGHGRLHQKFKDFLFALHFHVECILKKRCSWMLRMQSPCTYSSMHKQTNKHTLACRYKCRHWLSHTQFFWDTISLSFAPASSDSVF